MGSFAAGIRTPIQEARALRPHSLRYGRELGTMLQIWLLSLVYAPTAPIIMPFALLYTVANWFVWRNNILFVFERVYESGGQICKVAFQCMYWILFLAELFTGKLTLLTPLPLIFSSNLKSSRGYTPVCLTSQTISSECRASAKP